jgi:hypothetical protein
VAGIAVAGQATVGAVKKAANQTAGSMQDGDT